MRCLGWEQLGLGALALVGCSNQQVDMVPIGEVRPDIAGVVAADFPVPADAEFSLVTVCADCPSPNARFRVEVDHDKYNLTQAWRQALVDAGYEVIRTSDHDGFTFDETYFDHPAHDIDSEKSYIMIADAGHGSWAPVTYYQTWKDPHPVDHDPRAVPVLPGVLPDDVPLPIGTAVFSTETCYPNVCEAPYTKLRLGTHLEDDVLADVFETAFQKAGFMTEWRPHPVVDGQRRLHFTHADRWIDKEGSYVWIGYQVEVMLQLEPGATFADAASNE